MTLLPLTDIRTDGGTQPRAELNMALAIEYAEDMRQGARFPPVVVFYDGADYWLADGFHRHLGSSLAELEEIEVDVRQGTLQEAQWYSYSVNQTHGLRRSNEDKRRAVEAALAHEFAGRYSDNEIARHCGVSQPFVSKLRPSYNGYKIDAEPRTVTRNGKTYTMQTGNIGRRDPSGAAAVEGEPSPPAALAVETAPAPAVESLAVELPESRQVPAPAPAVVRFTTDVWQCDGVTIFNRDATAMSSYPEGAHLVVTSPPYNVGLEYASHDDDLDPIEYGKLLHRVFLNCFHCLVDGGRIAVVVPFGVGRNPWTLHAFNVATLLEDAGFTLRGLIIWDKGSSGNRTSWGSFRMSSDPSLRDTSEAIIVAHKRVSRLGLPAGVVKHDEKGSYTEWLADGDEFMNMAQDHWVVAPASATRIGHPAPFPVALVDRLIRFYAYPGAHVVDPFAGSGTVGVAARKLSCRATLIEVDRSYCEIAASRVMED